MYDNTRPKRFGRGTEKQTYCPDCDSLVPAAAFVAHREAEHPPRTISLAVEGIKSKAALGYDPPDPED